MASADFALLVGNGDYAGELARLHGPPNDVAAFAEWLVEPAGGGVPPQQVFVLSDGAPALPAGVVCGGLADHQRIYDRFFAADAAAVGLTQAAPPRPMRRLWVMFAGHGNMPARKFGVDNITACFVAQNWGRKAAFRGRVVPVEHVRRWVETFEEFDEVVVFMDCCRSEEPETLNPADPMGIGLAPAAPLPRRFAVLCACQADRATYEAPISGPGTPVRGVFSMAVLNGLRNHRDGLQRLSMGQLRSFVQANYANHFKGLRAVPEPELLDDMGAQAFQLIGGPKSQTPVTFRRRATTAAQYVQIESGVYVPVTGFNLGDDPVTIPLEAGAYFVRDVGGAKLAMFDHSSADGDTVDV